MSTWSHAGDCKMHLCACCMVRRLEMMECDTTHDPSVTGPSTLQSHDLGRWKSAISRYRVTLLLCTAGRVAASSYWRKNLWAA